MPSFDGSESYLYAQADLSSLSPTILGSARRTSWMTRRSTRGVNLRRVFEMSIVFRE